MAKKRPVSLALLRERDFEAHIPKERISSKIPRLTVEAITYSLFCVFLPERESVSVSLSMDSAEQARTIEGISLSYKKTCKIRDLPPHFLDSPLLIRYILSHEGTVHDISSVQIIADVAAAIIAKHSSLLITIAGRQKDTITFKLSSPFYEGRTIMAKEEFETLGVYL
jgi:hypothetical protein